MARLALGKEAPEQIVQRVDMLCNAFRAMGVPKPAASPMPRQLIAEWTHAVRRLAQEKVTKCDKTTIIVNALRTWNEFEEHLALRDRDQRPEAIDIQTFLHDSTQAPVRALNALRWLSNNDSLGWPLDKVSVPEPRIRSRGSTSRPLFWSLRCWASWRRRLQPQRVKD